METKWKRTGNKATFMETNRKQSLKLRHLMETRIELFVSIITAFLVILLPSLTCVTMPDGEVCEGRYATVVDGIVSPDMAAIGANSSTAIVVASASVSTGDIRGLQTSRAMPIRDRGTMMEFEGNTSGANPTHGFGIAKDNKGSIWKIIW